MEERQITVDGKTYSMQLPFMVLATQNPIEHEGTYRLPEAQLDRFLFKIVVPYPDEEQELAILTKFHALGNTDVMKDIGAVLPGEAIMQVRNMVKTIGVEPRLLRFIARMVHCSRNHRSVYLGASPRASLALMNAAKATAAMKGRDFVTPEDILDVAAPVLRHRLLLTPEKEMEGVTQDVVIQQIIHSLEIPR